MNCKQLHIIDESIFLESFEQCGKCEKECCVLCCKYREECRKVLENEEIKKQIKEEEEAECKKKQKKKEDKDEERFKALETMNEKLKDIIKALCIKNNLIYNI